MFVARWMALLLAGLAVGTAFGEEVFFADDFDAAPLAGWESAGVNTPIVVSGVWRRMVCAFNSRDNTRVNVYVATDKGSIGSVWIDNFTSAPAVPVSNPGFEDGFEGWKNTGATLDTAVASEGKQSVRMTLPLESDPPVRVERLIEVKPNTDYEFSIDMLVDDNFQGDCKFMVFDEPWAHCIMTNHGDPFAARVIESRDRNGKQVIGMDAAPDRPAQLSRRIEVPDTAANLCFSVDCNDRAFAGSFSATLTDPASGDTLLQLQSGEKKGEWRTLKGICVSTGPEVELTLRAEGEGVLEVDNVMLTPPRLIPEPQMVEWLPARDNFVLPETLTVSITGGDGAIVLDGAMELLEKDLRALGKKLVRTDAADAALRIVIDPKYAGFEEANEGYVLQVKSDGVNIDCGAAAGAFYGVMSILGLIDRYGLDYALPGCSMIDYPNLPLRGFSYAPSPEECARLKLNFYIVSTGYPEEPGYIAQIEELAATCRKYNLEFVPLLSTIRGGFYVQSKNPSLAVGETFAGEAVTLTGTEPAQLAHPYVIRTGLTDIVVTNAAGTRTYREGKDYTVIAGEMASLFTKLDTARKFAIARTPESGIGDGETVEVAYDAVTTLHPAYCPVEPQVRELNDAFFEDFTRRYELNYVHPCLCLMEFHGGEKELAADRRVARHIAETGESPLKLSVKDMFRNLDAMQKSNPDAKVLFFTGTVNDYAREAAPLLQTRAKDLVAIIWGYDAEWPNAYGVEAAKFWSSYGIPFVTMPWSNKRNIIGHAQLAKEAIAAGLPCLGTIGSNWPEGPGDLVASASTAWRVPRRGEKKYIEIKNLDSAGWEQMRPRWEDIEIKAAGDRAIPARRLMLEAPPRKIMAVPLLVPMPDAGRLMLAFNAEYPGGSLVHYAMKMFSDDQGLTWSLPEYLNSDDTMPAFGFNSMTCYLGDGVLLAYPITDGTLYRYRSTDYGKTWQKFSEIRLPEEDPHYYTWDPPLVTDGRIYETAYVYYRAGGRPDGELTVYGYYRISEDGGKTFGPDIIPPEWHGVNEVFLFRKRDGGFIGAGRRQNHNADGDQSDSLVVSLSSDGLNWSVPVEVQGDGRMHPSIVELPDGRLIMTYVVREGYPDNADGFPRYGIEAVESRDGGKSWNSAEPYRLAEFTAEQLRGADRWAASTQSTSSVLLPDGEILTVFGTAHRAVFGPGGRQMPRDLGLIRWFPSL